MAHKQGAVRGHTRSHVCEDLLHDNQTLKTLHPETLKGMSKPGAHLPEHTRRTLPPSLDLTWLNTILSASGDACADRAVLFSDTLCPGNCWQ